MTVTSTPARPNSSSSGNEPATTKRSREAYRRQLTSTRPGAQGVGTEARRAAAVILEVLAGVRTTASAASALKIRLARYYLWEQRAIQGLIAACEPRPRGRTVSADRRLAQLERELAVSRRELARHQALARTTQRALGLSPPSSSPPPAAGKARGPSCATNRRRRKPSTRALRAARLLRGADSSGDEASAAIQQAVVGPVPLGSAGGGIRPAATEAVHSEARTDHGGSNHAGRPKAVEHR